MKILNVPEKIKKTLPDFPQEITCEKCGITFEINGIEDCSLTIDPHMKPPENPINLPRRIGTDFDWDTKCPICGKSAHLKCFFEKF